jgi:hypothetical protein
MRLVNADRTRADRWHKQSLRLCQKQLQLQAGGKKLQDLDSGRKPRRVRQNTHCVVAGLRTIILCQIGALTGHVESAKTLVR